LQPDQPDVGGYILTPIQDVLTKLGSIDGQRFALADVFQLLLVEQFENMALVSD
jgi:hypothetical protein